MVASALPILTFWLYQAGVSLSDLAISDFGCPSCHILSSSSVVRTAVDEKAELVISGYSSDQSWALAVFFNFFTNEKLFIFCIFYQVNLTGGRLFKYGWRRNRLHGIGF